MSDLSKRIADLSPEKLALFAKRLKEKNADVSTKQVIPRRSESDFCALSFAQARLWFLNQLEPDSHLYNMAAAVRLTGLLNVVALKQSFQEIVRRHEALRTTFPTQDGQPTQAIATTLNLSLSVVNLRSLPKAQHETEVHRLATQEVQRPFDLTQGPLLRATLLQLSEAEQVLLLTMHHIVSDGWSVGVLIREVAALYEAFSTGKPSPLPELPIQYADFAHWQRQWLQGEVLAAQLSYWQQQLAGAPALLELPTDRPRPAVETFRGATQFLALPAPLSQKLKSLSQRSGVTLFMTLLAAFQTLLYRYTGQDDICIGSPIANRNRSETEELIGFFVNTLVLRTDMSENPSFQELLGRVREVTLRAYAHQDLPFEQLVEALQPERNLSHHPLFQVMFVLENTPISALELPDLTINSLNIDSLTAKFDLTMSMEDTEQGLVGSLEYNTDLFDTATISRMLEHFQTLLEGIVTEPDQRLSDLPLLTQPERQQLLVEWNDTQTKYPCDKCIHQLFEAQVQQTPNAVAVVFQDQQLTYHELNTRANQLAHHLRFLGVGPDGLVGICVERSLEMVIGMLGILKAGGAYVPLDPDYPSERLAHMLSDSQVPVLLTQEKLMSRLSEHQARVVCLDKDSGVTLTENEENPVSGVKPENLAYVIYTSGSTGKPKGVLVTHQGLCNLGAAQIRLFDLRSDSRVLQFASFSFDASIWEIVMALCSGGMLCLGTRESLLPGPSLMQFLLEHAITHMTLPPSALATLPTEDLPALQNIIVAGEACSTSLVAQWSKGRRLFNAYGPTESTVCGTVYECSNGSHKLPIGRPIINTQVYILDPHLHPVPVGVPGELYIGGAGLARGYLNRPELTSEKFICNPFSDEPRARLYKTGDLARYLPDGNIEFLGRLDDQVKIRGFRIELGEIEAVLGQHPAVNEAVVLVREDVPGNKRLVAYVVLNASPAPSMQELLHHFLKQQLPEYMVPSALVLLSALPLTPNGKIDRRALPAPDMARPEWSGVLVSPRTPVEEQLAGIWADVLGLQQVGIHDNFFEVGGDSILSIQIIARANQAGLKLTPKQLFQHQTIAELAEVTGTGEANQADQGLVTGEVLLTPIQRWFFEQELPQPHHWNQALLLEVRQPMDVVVLQQVVQQLLEHHDALRLRFVRQPNGWQQINALPDETLTVARVDLTALPKAEQSGAIEAAATELQASLNLESGWLVRVALFDLGPNQHQRLLLAIHHLLVDGVSWRILLEDLHTAYQQLSRGEAIVLPAKTTSFQTWVQRLSDYAQAVALEQELDYWLDCSGSGVAPLPLDYPQDKQVNTVASVNSVSVSLSLEETRALLQEVSQAYNSQINDVLLTALVQTFAQWTGTGCLLVDLEGHGREEILEGVDLSRTVGWFTTLFPVLLDITEASDLGEALKSVKEQLRCIPNRGIGYGLLRYLKEDKAIAQKLRAIPQTEVSFNYLGQFDQMLSPDGMFGLAKESSGSEYSLLGRRSHLLEINGFVAEGQLQLNWTYSSNLHQRATVERLAEGFMASVRSLIAHCQSPEAGGYTPSDFPFAKLGQKDLDKFIAKISQTTKLKENMEDLYELSPMQQGMFFHSLAAPESGVYVESLSCSVQGNLDISAFKRAWQKVVERHPVWRTSFYWEGFDKPLQVVNRCVSLPWQQHDWRGRSPVDQQEQLEAFIQAERKRGFELSETPLMRLALIQMDDDVYEFIWSHHHLLLDGWSLPLVLKEVFAFYEAFCQGQDLHLKRSRPYRDYIAWLQEQDLTGAEAFWRQALSGLSAPTPLSVDRALGSLSSEVESYDEQEIQLSVAATEALQSLARGHQLTVNTLVQGAWAILLSRYSGLEDVVFGATVSGRPANLAGVESMVGLFINTLAIRVQVSPQAFLFDWLQQLQAQLVELRQYEYSSLVQVQGWSDVPRGLPLFESIVVFENYPVDASLQKQGGSLEFRKVRDFEQTNYPLTLVALPGAQLSLQLSYDCRRFDATTISRMLRHLQTLLEGIVANPGQRLKNLSLLTQQERHTLLVEWNDTQVDYPKDVCIHQLFEAHVKRTPDAVAVVFEDQQLTYRELNRRANQVAHHLRSLDVDPDSLVGICIERSLEMVIGLLGILKAGGAYVPLDPDYPSERLAYTLNDSQIPVLVTTQKLLTRLPEHQARVVCLDKDWGINSADSDVAPVTSVTDENLAYVIYTSGSTGKPKGVAITHRSLVNAYLAWEDAYQLQSLCTSHLQMASFSFDVFSGDLVRALCSGAKLVICPREWLLEPEKLYELMLQEKVDCADFVPALLRNLIQYLERTKQDLSFMRLLIVGSDSWLVKEYQQFQRFCGAQTRLINAYGVSEATIDSSYFESAAVTLSVDRLVPIGRPFANTQIYILDSNLQPVPIGVAGELHIGGVGLAQGYLNQPKLTEQKFIPNPLSNEPGDRLYKTGDLGRYLPDGTIEFLGRLDDQVKIRGFRIELGEIEAVLGQHPAVDETVVMVREDVPGNKRLVAYVVVNQTSAPTVSQLHQFLKQKLPEYMIPSAIVKLEALPLTPNGKVDRRALLAPDTAKPELQSAFVAPRDTLELQLAQIWEDVLNVRPIGVTDNFFTLGGHSLLAVRLIALLQQQFEQNLPLATLFLAPTIEHLASTLRQPTDERQWSPLVKIQSGGSKRPFFCVPGSGGNVIYFYHLARHLGSDQPFYGLQARGLDGEQMPHTQVEDMAAYYIEALQTVQPQGPYLLGGHSFGSYIAFEMALQLLHQGQEVAMLAILDTSAPVSTNKPVEAEHDDDARYLIDLAMTIEQLVGKNLSVSYEDLQRLAPDEQLNYILERLKTVNVFPPEAKLSQLRGLVQVFKANNQTHYVPHEVYPNQITVFPASEEFCDDPAMGWDKVSSEPVETYSVPGDHLTMVTEPHVRVLAQKLRACLDKAQADDERK